MSPSKIKAPEVSKSSKAPQPSKVAASPTKRFFIDMLTRDIELQDAILDLLDNCVDGVQRTNKGKLNKTAPYEGYWAKITFDERHFEISDNCGGIPLNLAEKYAFMMGRPKEEADLDIPTVGMYGIGMKRALFKMGQSSTVTSKTSAESFEVHISPSWLTDDLDWNLPLKFISSPRSENGTKIRIERLRPSVSKIFTKDGSSPFPKTLIDLISHHFGFIIKKGFEIYVNKIKVPVRNLTLLRSEERGASKKGISPYQYKANIEGVEVSLAVGFYTPMIDSDTLDEEQVTRRSTDDAGWTIICNDRVVVYNDKSRLTGWGEAGVPNYHTQFIGISGVVHFKSNDAWKLPVTTTKRGVDTSSNIYLYVKDFMREGLKKFTSYTNIWKQDTHGEKAISTKAKNISIESLLSTQPDTTWVKVRNKENERKFIPELAAPTNQDPKKQIRFSRQLSEIVAVSNYLFGTSEIAPGDVGEACFEEIYKKI